MELMKADDARATTIDEGKKDEKNQEEEEEKDDDEEEDRPRQRQQRRRGEEFIDEQAPGEEEDGVFPGPFYCPLTGRIMKDPVVHPDGTSFERSAIVSDTNDDVVYYPNRALQSIIQQEVLRRNVPLQRTVDSMKKSFLGLVQRSSMSLSSPPAHQDTGDATAARYQLSEHYYCSITLDIMKNPVIDPDGETFERRAIVNWIKINGDSPATRNPLTVKQLYKNTAIKNLLDEEKARDDDSIDHSIRRWKEQDNDNDDTEDNDDDEYIVSVEEGDHHNHHPESGGATLELVTPTTIEEIQELRRQRLEERRRRLGDHRFSRFRLYVTLLVVLVGFIYFPYPTIAFLILLILILICAKRLQMQQQERRRRADREEERRIEEDRRREESRMYE